MSWKKGFGRRLKLYGIGLGLGSLLAWALVWRNHTDGPALWPADKIRESIRERIFTADVNSLTQLNGIGLNAANLDAWIDSSKVRLSKSEPRKEPRMYFLENPSETTGMYVELGDSTFRIVRTVRLK
jgi:hypothetical protein